MKDSLNDSGRKNPLDNLVTESQLAVRIDKSEDTLYHYRQNLGLPYIKVGRDIYYWLPNVAEWFKEHQVTQPEKTVE